MEASQRGRQEPALIRVLVGEDEEPLRAAICDLIASEAGFELVGMAADAETAIALAAEMQPDVALLDVRMPGGGGAHAAAGIRDCSPPTRMIALSAYDDRSNVLEMLRAGAVSYLVKGEPPDEIVEAIRRAVRGQGSLSTNVVTSLVAGVASDLADRSETDEVLRESEARFRGLLESAPDAVAIIDRDGLIVLVNEQTERMFGWRRAELIGQSIENLLPRRFHEAHTGLRTEYFANPSTRLMGAGLELAGLRKDGSEFPVDISLAAIETDDGRLATAFIRDVTERKAIEVTRRKTEERFLALLESAPDPVVVIDDAGRIVLVNAQTERLFGYDRAELHNQPVEILLPDRFRDRHVRHRLGFLTDPRTRPMGAGRELAGRRKNGTEFPVDISLSGIETSEGRLAAAFIRDVTNREARVELERSIAERRAVLDHVVTAGEEERQRIAADIHDDSIQVMTAVGMRLQILRRGLSDDEQLVRISELQETVRLAIGRLRHLLFALRPPALDNEGLAAALHLYVEELGKSASTSYRLDDRLVSQPSQATRVIIYRIAQEVLTNVVKHAQASRSTILLSEREGGYFVRIEDDGIGFDGSAARSRPGHLGLAAIQERAELADGWLKVESAPGAGTKVEFWLPPDREPQDHLPTVELQVR